MKHASDFRRIARNALFGRWPIAVLAGFVAALFGAELVETTAVSVNFNVSTESVQQPEVSNTLLILTLIVSLVLLAFVWLQSLVVFLLGGTVKLGYTRFNLNLIDGKEVSFRDLFSQFRRFGQGFLMDLLINLYTFLWALLFIIPGIIKAYSYAMTPYILYEHPEYSVSEAIKESQRIMKGNKWRLFCLSFSFIGWDLLCALPVIFAMGISAFSGGMILLLLCSLLSFAGSLFLCPYKQAAFAAFYREISSVEPCAENLTEEPTEEHAA